MLCKSALAVVMMGSSTCVDVVDPPAYSADDYTRARLLAIAVLASLPLLLLSLGTFLLPLPAIAERAVATFAPLVAAAAGDEGRSMAVRQLEIQLTPSERGAAVDLAAGEDMSRSGPSSRHIRTTAATEARRPRAQGSAASTTPVVEPENGRGKPKPTKPTKPTQASAPNETEARTPAPRPPATGLGSTASPASGMGDVETTGLGESTQPNEPTTGGSGMGGSSGSTDPGPGGPGDGSGSQGGGQGGSGAGSGRSERP